MKDNIPVIKGQFQEDIIASLQSLGGQEDRARFFTVVNVGENMAQWA